MHLFELIERNRTTLMLTTGMRKRKTLKACWLESIKPFWSNVGSGRNRKHVCIYYESVWVCVSMRSLILLNWCEITRWV